MSEPIEYHPRPDKSCASCGFSEGRLCEMWDCLIDPEQSCAYWIKKREKGIDGDSNGVYTSKYQE